MKRFSVPITKRNDELQLVYGYASTPARDFDGDIITLACLKAALPDYMDFANIREMHGMNAVGVTKEAEVDDKGLYICAKIVDPLAWLKVKEGVYKAFSIGGNATDRDPDDAHTITGLQLIEISIVDRPANPEAIIDVFKASEVEKGNMGTVEEEKAMRAELLSAVDALSGDTLKAAVEALRKSQKPVAIEPEPQAPKPAPVVAPVAPEEPPARRVARCMKTPGSADLCKAVATAVGFTEKQFAGVMSLDERGLANWLGNNAGLLENIQKAIPDDSALWKGKAAVVAVTKKKEAEDDKDDEKPKGDYGSHADAEYADPGLQDDKKPRYPLKDEGKWSEERIRAAWDYINKEKNQKPYSSADVEKIKDKIISAWKAHIDEDGPPSAEKKKAHSPHTNTENDMTTIQPKPDAKGDLRKGLMTASSALGLLDRLSNLHEAIAAEEAREGDNSAVPSRFEQLLEMCASAVQAYIDEEIEEMLEGEDDDYGMPYCDYVMYADSARNILKRFKFGGPVIADRLEKAMGDRTGSKGYANLLKFCERVIKTAPSGESGDWAGGGMPVTGPQDNKQDWKQKAQSVHDASVEMGASCTVIKAKKKKAKEDEDDEDEKKKCAKCGHMNEPDAEKCAKCEKAFGKAAGKKGTKTCPHCGDDEQKEDAKTCTECEKDMAEEKAAKKKKAPKGKDDEGGDDEEEDTDGEDDNEDDDEGGDDNPKKPAKKPAKAKKAASVEDFLDALQKSPLAHAVADLQDQFAGLNKNPPKPGKAVTKTQDVDTPKPADKPEDTTKALSPAETLKACLGSPNYFRNGQT